MINFKKYAINELFEKLEVGEIFDIKENLLKIYGSEDIYIRRSYDVMAFDARKLLPERTFKTIKGQVKRLT